MRGRSVWRLPAAYKKCAARYMLSDEAYTGLQAEGTGVMRAWNVPLRLGRVCKSGPSCADDLQAAQGAKEGAGFWPVTD